MMRHIRATLIAVTLSVYGMLAMASGYYMSDIGATASWVLSTVVVCVILYHLHWWETT